MKNTFNLEKVEAELSNRHTITERLNYWSEVINKFVKEPVRTKGPPLNEEGQLVKILGKGISILTPLYIPQKIYDKYFREEENSPEFKSWFLKYYAKSYFESERLLQRWDEKINSPIAQQFIQAELDALGDFEKKANELLQSNKIDIYSYSNVSFAKLNNPYYKEIELLRIKGGYYETRGIENVDALGNVTVEIYAKHILLKEFLKNELLKISPADQVKIKGFTLKSQFIHSDQFDEIINKLLKAGNVEKDQDGDLLFIPIGRKNAQYEAVTLFEALNKSGLLKNRERTYDEIGKILSNTFKDWNLSVRTISDKKTLERLSDYEAIIS